MVDRLVVLVINKSLQAVRRSYIHMMFTCYCSYSIVVRAILTIVGLRDAIKNTFRSVVPVMLYYPNQRE